jgi:hypothetical protein
MDRREALGVIGGAVGAAVGGGLPASAGEAKARERRGKMTGMYIHQHWPYNHPYAARTWTLEDWRGYTGGLKQIGFDTVLIWPMVETIPDPPTPSDLANLEKLRRVIDMLHDEQGMRAYVVLCPNIIARDEEARKATFQKRHYFYCEDLVNPGDEAAIRRMMTRREKFMKPLAKVDGVAIIDSDPGGYPGSKNEDFVRILRLHREMFDRLRPGIELLYWVHAGWRGWSKMYETGKITFATPDEYRDCLRQVAAMNPEPWGLANGLEYARELGFPERVISFNYGRIEGEPSFPMTNFTGQTAYEGARSEAPRGVMGNSQTHCVQLPNTFAFARGAHGLPLTDAEYVRFANDLIPGQGELIVEAWRTLPGTEAAAMRDLAARLEGLPDPKIAGGPLKGLLFGSSRRFVTDLVKMLRYRAALNDFAAASEAGQPVREPFARFIEAASRWQSTHGYENNWGDPRSPRLYAALQKLDHPALKAAYEITYEVRTKPGPGESYFDVTRRNFAEVETLTPRFLSAMREALKDLG